MPWFWNGQQQGGGVLNDMMCHSILVVRQLLAPPGAAVVDAGAEARHWSHRVTQVVAQGLRRATQEVDGLSDYLKTPSEDFASVNIEFEAPDGSIAIGEATTSWSFVGPGLRLSAELLAPSTR
jgi:predicted dehydrogenase